MKNFWKAEILQMAQSDIFDVIKSKLATMITMLKSKICYDPDLLSYKHFFARKLISKMRSKSLWLMHFWLAAAAQRRLWRHWNSLGMDVLIKPFKESGLVPETTLRTQPNRRFPEHEKSLIFGILAKGGTTWKHFGNLKFYKWLKVTYLMKNQALITMLQS